MTPKNKIENCFVCCKPLTKLVGSCLCFPPCGDYHIECSPHKKEQEAPIPIKQRIEEKVRELLGSLPYAVEGNFSYDEEAMTNQLTISLTQIAEEARKSNCGIPEHK